MAAMMSQKQLRVSSWQRMTLIHCVFALTDDVTGSDLNQGIITGIYLAEAVLRLKKVLLTSRSEIWPNSQRLSCFYVKDGQYTL